MSNNSHKYFPIEEDPGVPDNAILIAEVTVSQYALPDGTLGLRTLYNGSIPLSSILGLLAMGGIKIYNRCNIDIEGE